MSIIRIDVLFNKVSQASLARVNYAIPQFFSKAGYPYALENSYLRQISIKLRKKSTETFAEHIKEFIIWRIQVGIEVQDITDDDFENYTNALCNYTKENLEKLSWNTINSRISSAYRFLIWCYKNSHNKHIEIAWNARKNFGRNNHARVKGHPAKQKKDTTKFLLMEDAINFIDTLKKSSAKNEHNRIRNSLIAKLMLQSGLRISEAVGFPIAELPEINQNGHSTPARIIGKGGKRRLVLIPNKLLSDLWFYSDITREHQIQKLEEKKKNLTGSDLLFISTCGNPLTSNWMQKIFIKTSKEIGIKTVPHALRHTYGTYHYLYNKDLTLLSKLMGHEYEATTEKYYVHLAKIISHSNSYEELQLFLDQKCHET